MLESADRKVTAETTRDFCCNAQYNCCSAQINRIGAADTCTPASSIKVYTVLEITQEILENVAPLIDAGDTESAGKMLAGVDQTLLRAVLIHILREWGSEVADRVGVAYLREHESRLQAQKESLHETVAA